MYVAIDEDGITTGAPGLASKSLAWSRISRIREVDGGLKLYGLKDDRNLNMKSLRRNLVIRFAELQDVTLVTEQTSLYGVPISADPVIQPDPPQQQGFDRPQRFQISQWHDPRPQVRQGAVRGEQ